MIQPWYGVHGMRLVYTGTRRCDGTSCSQQPSTDPLQRYKKSGKNPEGRTRQVLRGARGSFLGCFYTLANAKKNTISTGNVVQPHQMAPTPILQCGYHLPKRNLAVAVATSPLFRAECIKKPRRRLVRLYNEAIRIIGGFRFLTACRAERDLAIIKFKDIHGKGSFINDVVII